MPILIDTTATHNKKMNIMKMYYDKKIGFALEMQPLVKSYTRAISKDIENFILAVKNKEPITIQDQKETISLLRGLTITFNQLADSSEKQSLMKSLRLLVLVIENRAASFPDSENLLFRLNQIHQIIGYVPTLNPVVPLPNIAFLPPKFQKTIESWKEDPWDTPKRGKEKGGQNVGFITQKGEEHAYSSARLHLITEDGSGDERALSYADADIYYVADLQADHLQPSENILERQLELIEAMNYDPRFRKAIINNSANKDYFLLDEGKIVGSKYFFMVYHNCIDNLWLINPRANSGTGKGSQDVISWLQQHKRFGDKFLQSIQQEKNINKQFILFTCHDGKMLAKAAKLWFKQVYAQEITTSKFVLSQIKTPMLTQAALLSSQEKSSQNKKDKVHLMAKMALSSNLVQPRATKPQVAGLSAPGKRKVEEAGLNEEEAESITSSQESIATTDAELTEDNLKRMSTVLDSPSTASQVQSLLKNSAKNYTQDAKKRRVNEELLSTKESTTGATATTKSLKTPRVSTPTSTTVSSTASTTVSTKTTKSHKTPTVSTPAPTTVSTKPTESLKSPKTSSPKLRT